MSLTPHLRAPTAEDIPALVALVNCPGVRFGTMRVPLTSVEWVKSRVPNTNPAVTSVVAEVDGVARGWASLVRGQARAAHSGTLGMSVHDDFTGQGLGRAMLGALIDVADNWLGLVRLSLSVNVDNKAAIGLYASLGFEVEGRLRGDIIRDGQLVDSFAMARLKAPLAPPAPPERMEPEA